MDYTQEPTRTPSYSTASLPAGNRQALAGGTFNTGGICNPNHHYFECKHEPTCYCGMTRRQTELELPEGI